MFVSESNAKKSNVTLCDNRTQNSVSHQLQNYLTTPQSRSLCVLVCT